MIIKKKIWPEYFEAVQSGKKTFEIRLADWECNPGDVLTLEEWDSNTKQYTGLISKKYRSFIHDRG